MSERTPVGNLYVNREITGAMVGRQPFGGGKLSGTGPKAGGPDYLLQFVEARAVTENTVRHGLVVGIQVVYRGQTPVYDMYASAGRGLPGHLPRVTGRWRRRRGRSGPP